MDNFYIFLETGYLIDGYATTNKNGHTQPNEEYQHSKKLVIQIQSLEAAEFIADKLIKEFGVPQADVDDAWKEFIVVSREDLTNPELGLIMDDVNSKPDLELIPIRKRAKEILVWYQDHNEDEMPVEEKTGPSKQNQKPVTIPTGGLMTEAEAAAYLNHSPNTLNAWRCQRKGPKWTKVGKRSVRYRKEDLDDYLCTVVLPND